MSTTTQVLAGVLRRDGEEVVPVEADCAGEPFREDSTDRRFAHAGRPVDDWNLGHVTLSAQRTTSCSCEGPRSSHR